MDIEHVPERALAVQMQAVTYIRRFLAQSRAKQELAVEQFVKKHQGNVLAICVEPRRSKGESQSFSQLIRAVETAKETDAVLVTSHLSNLSANWRVLDRVLGLEVQILACDVPSNSIRTVAKMTKWGLEEFARRSRAKSDTIRRSLAELKKSGRVLGQEGRHNLTDKGRKLGAKRSVSVRKQKAEEAYQHLRNLIADWHVENMSYREVARQLNAVGERTRRGKFFSHVQVKRLIEWMTQEEQGVR